MKKSTCKLISLFMLLMSIYFAAGDSYALDAPHNIIKTVACSNCHDASGTASPWRTQPTGTPYIDNTYANNLCTSCHYATNSDPRFTNSKYKNVETHSSYQTNGTNSGAGAWVMDCRTCHNAHYQAQVTSYPTSTVVSFVTGTCTYTNGTTLTVSNTLTAASYTNWIIVPNTAYPTMMYRVTGNTANTVSVDAAMPINAGLFLPTGSSKTYVIRYPNMVKNQITTPNSGVMNVRFFNNSGPGSFATSSTSVDGVCQVCHDATLSFNNTGTLEGGLTRGGSHPTGKAGTNCTTCHTHDTGFKGGGCDACHGDPPVVNSQNTATITNGLANNEGGTGSTTAGAHNKHVNSAGLVCNDCHMGGMPSSTIYDKKIQIGFAVGTVSPIAVAGNYDGRASLANGYTYSAGNALTTWSQGNTLTCTVYCHSTVQPNGGGAGAPVYTSVTWTATGTVVCGSCHATTAGTPRGLISTGSHTPHLSSTLMTTIQCEDCHTGAGAGTSYTAPNHINYSIEVADGYTPSAGGAPGNGYGTCATASCHGNKGTPNWSRVSAANTDPCTKCHGTRMASPAPDYAKAPPNDIAGSSTGSAVGAHQKHLQSTAYSVPMACAECHNVPTAANFTAASHLAPGATEVSFSTTPTNSLAITGGATPTYNYGTQTCSTVYCHDSTFFKYNNWGVGSNPTPTWNNANYLSGTAAQKCGTCHGYPPDTSTGKHPSPGTDCQSCHQHVNATNDGFLTAFTPSTGGIELHVNGHVEGAGCNGCHGDPPTAFAYGSPSGLVGSAYNTGDTGATNNNPASPGAHDKHTSALAGGLQMTCDGCHTGSVMSDHKIQMGFAVSNTTYPGFIGSVNTGTFTGYNSLKNTYSFAANPGTNLTLTNNYANANSCAVYCHGSTMPNNGGTVSVPTWTNASSGACNACHGASAATPPTLGAHAKHAGSTNLNLSCDKCHGATVETTHVDGSVAWSLATGDPRFSSSATYSNAPSGSSGRLAPSATYGSCAVYCHSNASPLSGTTITVPTAWSSAITNCGACHSKFDDASPTWSAPHTKHIKSYSANTNFTCYACHANTAQINSNTAVASGLSNTFHVNAVKDVKFGGIAYSSSASYTTATGCQNTYCHSTGQTPGAPTHAPFTWSGTMPAGCVGCHGGDQTTSSKLASGSHFAHINSTTNIGRNIGCTECHNATVISNQTLSNLAIHVDKNVNIKFDNVTNKNGDGPAYETVSTITPTGAAITAGTPGVCSNLYCHSSGNLDAPTGGNIVISAGVPSFKTPTWGAAGLACDGCHGDQAGKSWPTYGTGPAGSTTANSHVKHVDTVTGSALSCDYCHVKTTISTTVTANTMTLVTGASTSHLNRVEDVFFKLNGGMTGTYNPTVTSKTCAATYCHGSGNPQWGGAALGCNACHQSQGADGTASYSGKHQKHVDTAGYDFSCEACHALGTTHAGGPATGTNPGGGPVGAYQTVEMRYTALSAGTMTTGQKYRGSASTYKYTSIASNPFGAATTPAFSAGTSTSADANNSAITFYTNGSCSSIWCHSNANPAGGANSYATPTWGATMTCGSCHNQATDTTGLTWSPPHTKHIKSYSTNALMSCNACHAGTAADNSTLVTVSTGSHVNAKKDVIYNSTIATTGTYTAGQGCQNTYCHSNGTKLAAPYTASTTSWQSPLPSGCGSCHGSGASNGVPSYTSGGANKANSHVAHVTTQGYACVDCHSNTVDVTNTITNVVTHVNRTYDVAGAKISLFTQGTNTGGTCTNTCHGTGTTITQWGKNWPGNDACTKCHGTLTSGATGSVMTLASGSYPWAPQAYLSAPSPTPNASGLFTDLSATRVGTHQQHLTTNPYRLPIACQECHVVPATPVSGSHMSGPTATVTFPSALSSYLANTHEGALTPNAAYASATCSTNYCHDSSYFKNGRNNLADIWSNVAGTVPQPLWNNTTMLTQTSPTTADCNKCHGYPPGGTHPSPVADCDSCHPHVATGSLGFKAVGTPGIELHMDGKVEGGGCNGCHAYDVVGATYAGGVWSGGTWTHSIARDGIGQGWGAHAVHINHIKTRLNMTGTLNTSGTFGQGEAANVCGTCHTNINDAAHHTTGGSTTGRQITFGDGTYKYGGASGFDFRFVTGATPTYYGASGTSSSVSPKTCSNVSCHFSNSPVWSAY